MRNLRSQEEIMASWKGEPDKPVVSICCITYNHEPYIEDALEGFLIQETDFAYEILIHDDASTDRTAEIIREYEYKYPKLIKPIYQTINQFSQGKRMNAEFNFTRALGDYLAICEGDDFWTSPVKLIKQVEALSQSVTASISFHPTEVLTGKSQNKPLLNGYGYYGKSTQFFLGGELISQAGPAMAMCSIIVKKHVIECLKEKSPKFFFTRMSHFFLQSTALMQGEACYIPDFMASYRYGHEGSWSSKCSVDASYRFNQIEKFIEALDELAVIFPNKHVKAISRARRKKLRQAYRLTRISVWDKFRLYKFRGDKTFMGVSNFIIELFMSLLLTIKNICNPIMVTLKLKKSEIN